MAIWVQNVENTGFVPEAPVSDCRQRTVQTAFGLFSTLPCRRQCDHSRGCSSKCELGLSVSRGGGTLPPLPPRKHGFRISKPVAIPNLPGVALNRKLATKVCQMDPQNSLFAASGRHASSQI